ncbi:DUF2062 domain-containing protein [Comamonadaceae bacterium G21597-S1]|nr:DUF2062 domain-containing protein [Comamonadaceae bacterium G21597-S1]
MGLRERLRALVPTRAQIHDNRWLRWLGPLLRRPRLWRWSRRGVALGVALGIFFGLLIPVAQIPLSVGAAVVLRANVPAAAVSTLVTNPLTFGPLYYAAFKLGHWVTGSPPKAGHDEKSADELHAAGLPKEEVRLWQRMTSVGKPLLLGLAIIATLMGLLSYALIALTWHAWTWFKRRKRRLP